MKKKLVWALIVAALFSAVAFTGCKGKDGVVYLTVTYDSSRYGCYGGFEQGLGIGSGWEFNKKYEVNPGTWLGAYDLAYFSYYSGGDYYYRVNSISGYYYTSYGSDYAGAIAQAAFNNYDYVSGEITIAKAEKGGFLKDGEDKNYVLDLAWYVEDTTLTYDSEPMTKRVVSNTADKVVLEFSGAPEMITLSFNKKPISKDVLKNLNMNQSSGAIPAKVGTAKAE